MEVIRGKLDQAMNIQIPPSFASELGLEPESEVSFTMTGEAILIRPISQPYLLDTLLERVNESNLHGETSTGKPVGKEVW